MESKYLLEFHPFRIADLKANDPLVDLLKNRIRQVFMTPSLIINGKQEILPMRIMETFASIYPESQMIFEIPGSILEILIPERQVLVHIVFSRNKSDISSTKVSIIINQYQISPIANSDTSSTL